MSGTVFFPRDVEAFNTKETQVSRWAWVAKDGSHDLRRPKVIAFQATFSDRTRGSFRPDGNSS